jgi:ribosomal protein L37AE/L43A
VAEKYEDDANRAEETRVADKRAVTCPFCRSTEVELLSLFGSQLSTDQWYCRACHTPFERFRRDDE